MISVYSIHVHVHVDVVELCCVSLYIGRCLEVCLYTWFGVWLLWWFNYPGLLLNTKLECAC